MNHQERSHPPAGGRPEKVNFFRPSSGYLRREVALIWVMLAGWGLMTFGFQFLILLLQRDPAGTGVFSGSRVFGFPFHFWFSGQFVILGFVLLCVVFNFGVDRLQRRYRQTRGGR